LPSECLATFDTTTDALRFERTCRDEGIVARIVPVPRSLSASCGLACRFPCGDRDRVRTIAASRGLDVTEYHELSDPW
jgi:hypothetical protein